MSATRTVPLPSLDCARCGAVHERCHAHNKAGKACGLWPADGAVVCTRLHGGAAPQVRANALARVERAAVVAVVQSFRGEDVGLEVDPVGALMEEFRATVAQVRWLRSATAALESDDQAGGGGGRKLHVLHELHDQRSRHLASLVIAMGRLGIEERRLRLEEDQANDAADMLVAGLTAAGVPADRFPAALAAMAAHRAQTVGD